MKLKDLMLSITPMLAAILATTWSHGAFAQNANQALSNLTSPTAINQSLLVNADNTYDLGSSTDALHNIYVYGISFPQGASLGVPNVSSGNGYSSGLGAGTSLDTSGGSGGNLNLDAGGATTGGGGNVSISSGTGDTGGVILLLPGTASSGASHDGYINMNGHVFSSALDGAPSVSSCGTGPSMTGSDVVGHVTVGTGGAAASCKVTFGETWPSTPICTVGDETAVVALKVVPTTTTLTISAAANFAASTVLDYHCIGYSNSARETRE